MEITGGGKWKILIAFITIIMESIKRKRTKWELTDELLRNSEFVILR